MRDCEQWFCILYTVPVSVLVDNQEICDSHDIFSAICLFFALHYIFDIEYALSLNSTKLFLDTHEVLHVESSKITATVQRRINCLK